MTINNIAFLCHPYHRGGVTQWMLDAVKESVIQNKNAWFVTIEPVGFVSEGKRPTMRSLLQETGPRKNLSLIAPKEGVMFQFGTVDYRARVYANELIRNVPFGTSVILSDDPSVWRVTRLLSRRFNFIGVIHSVDDAYFDFLKDYYQYLSNIVAVSKRISDKASAFLPNIKIETIPCGIVLPPFEKQRSERIFSLIWVGRIEERSKRVSDIPLIAQKLRSKGIRFRWKIIGHGTGYDLLRKTINDQKLDTFFEFTGWLERNKLYDELDQSDIFVLTSNFEGMPIVVMEALSKGLGVVSTYVSGVEDLEKDNLVKNVLRLYPVGETEKAVSAIIDFIEIDSDIVRKEARRVAEKFFSIESCMNQYYEIIQNSEVEFVIKENLVNKTAYALHVFLSYIISRLRLIKHNLECRFNLH